MYRLARLIFVYFLLLVGQKSWAQQTEYGFHRRVLSEKEKALNLRSNLVHSNIQPAAHRMDSTYFQIQDSNYTAKGKPINICMGPVFDVNGGFQYRNNTQPIANGFAGLDAYSFIGKKLFVALGYTFNISSPAEYLTQFSDSLRILPGVGYAVKDGNNLFHSHYTSGRISYFTGKYFHFELGKGKHFWGDGYRSMILSDVANAYPYARITTQFWKIRFTNLWAQMKDISAGQLLKDARKKYVALHSLSWNVSKSFNWSLYEMVVWQDRDSNSVRTLDINYLNPVVFYRPVEYAQGSPDNVLIGTSFRWKAAPKLQFYGQLVIDEFFLDQYKDGKKWWGNKYGGQLGLKAFDVIIPNLHLQWEVNAVRPYTYTHGSPIQAWGHLNQPLAHPMGANFAESIWMARYHWGKWDFSEKFIWAAFGRDRDKDEDGIIDNFGGNIFRSYKNPFETYGNDLLQGLKSTFHYQELTAARAFGTEDAFEAYASYIMRIAKNEFDTQIDHMILIGVRVKGLMSPQQDF